MDITLDPITDVPMVDMHLAALIKKATWMRDNISRLRPVDFDHLAEQFDAINRYNRPA